jgi:hypothetical protein
MAGKVKTTNPPTGDFGLHAAGVNVAIRLLGFKEFRPLDQALQKFSARVAFDKLLVQVFTRRFCRYNVGRDWP